MTDVLDDVKQAITIHHDAQKLILNKLEEVQADIKLALSHFFPTFGGSMCVPADHVVLLFDLLHNVLEKIAKLREEGD